MFRYWGKRFHPRLRAFSLHLRFEPRVNLSRVKDLPLLYAATLHLLAGAVTGSVFKVRSLVVLLALVFAESVILVLTRGNAAGVWGIANLIAVQVGYFAGMYGRAILEQAGYRSSVRPRRLH